MARIDVVDRNIANGRKEIPLRFSKFVHVFTQAGIIAMALD